MQNAVGIICWVLDYSQKKQKQFHGVYFFRGSNSMQVFIPEFG